MYRLCVTAPGTNIFLLARLRVVVVLSIFTVPPPSIPVIVGLGMGSSSSSRLHPRYRRGGNSFLTHLTLPTPCMLSYLDNNNPYVPEWSPIYKHKAPGGYFIYMHNNCFSYIYTGISYRLPSSCNSYYMCTNIHRIIQTDDH